MKYLLFALILFCAAFVPLRYPPLPRHAPQMKPATLGGELWPSYLPTPTVTP